MHVPFACHPPTYFTINSRSMQRWWCRDSHMQFLLAFPAKVTWKDLAGQRKTEDTPAPVAPWDGEVWRGN